MARNLAHGLAARTDGASQLWLCDTDAARAGELKSEISAAAAGLDVRVASGLGEVRANAETVLLSLPSEAAGEAVLLELLEGGGGGGEASSPIARVVDMGTVSPAYSSASSAKCHTAGVAYLDAPVSGGPEGADAGTLSVMVGGDEAEVELLRPLVFDAIGSYVVHLGGSGAGTAAKLVNQQLVGIHAAAACEAMTMARSLGIKDLAPLLELLDRSWGNSFILQRVGAVLLEAQRSADDGVLMTSGAPIRNLKKDMGIVDGAAEATGLTLGVSSAAKAIFDEGGRAPPMADADFAALTLLLDPTKEAPQK